MFISHVALAKYGIMQLVAAVHSSVRLSVRLSVRQCNYQSKVFVCVSNTRMDTVEF